MDPSYVLARVNCAKAPTENVAGRAAAGGEATGCGNPASVSEPWRSSLNRDYSFMCGSSQSRSALPMRLITSVVTKMARPGKVAIHHEVSM